MKMKIVTIIENNPITGVVYGVKEVADTPIISSHRELTRAYQKVHAKKAAVMLKRAERTKKK